MLRLKNERGIAVVFVALAMFVIIGFVGLGIDIGYMYVVKGELQNAADAAALAGVAKLDGSALTSQFLARGEAQKFAGTNYAARESVQIDQNTSNATNGDVVIGWWNGSDVVTPPSGGFCNAVKVTCRRTSESGTGISSLNKQVNTFFAQVIGWNKMSAKAQAIAYMPPTATAPMPLCPDALTLPVPTRFYFKQSQAPAMSQNVAFTEFGAWSQGQPQQNTNYGPDSLVAQYIREEATPPDVCGKGIYTNNAGGDQIITVLQEKFAFENNATGLTGNAMETFTGTWDVIVPIGCIVDPNTNACAANPCDPNISGSGVMNKFTVQTYAKLTITRVTSNPTPSIYVSAIQDIGCNPNPLGLGLKPRLAK